MTASAHARQWTTRARWTAGGCLVLFLAASLLGDTAWNTCPGGRWHELSLAGAGKTGFTLLSPTQTGVLFTNAVSEQRHLTNQVLLNGSGVCAGDVDGDGWVDLYFCGLDGPNKLYRNLGGWRFEDITEQAGVACAALDATGATFADVDGDGDLDLIVNSLCGGTHIFLNDGHGHFSPSPLSPVLNERMAGTSLALADMNGTGALDLYVANYRNALFFLDNPEARFTIRMINGQPKVVAIEGHPLTDPEYTNRFIFDVRTQGNRGTFRKEELGQPDAFYRNDGHGKFSPVSWTDGTFLDEEGHPLTQPPFDWGLSVVFRDLNGDGRPDLYICNDFRTPDRIWINDGQGHFRALPRRAIRQTCFSAMGMDVADLNRDGHFDLFVADMLSVEHPRRLLQRIDTHPDPLPPGALDERPQVSRNTVQLSRGDGTFAEIAQFCGLQAAEWAWAPAFLDVDLDGYEDLLIPNGFERDTMNLDAMRDIESQKARKTLSMAERMAFRKLYPRLATPKLAFRNLGNLKFADVSAAWGFDTPGISQGLCLADLDNDGDLDVVVNNFNSVAGIYRNETVAPRLAIRLRGLPPNTRGIGAKIEILGGPVYQSQEMVCGGRYLSSDDPMRTFAVGSLTNELKIVVTWRSGLQTVIFHARGNRLYEVEEAASVAVAAAPPKVTHPPHFKDVSVLLAHTHHEELFDDFERQPLLPRRLSQPGPGVCWFDVDGDGRDDLVIGTGGGGKVAVFRNEGLVGFKPWAGAPFDEISARDVTTVLGWRRPNGQAMLVAGLSSYEDGQTSSNALRFYDLTGKTFLETLPGQESSLGPMSLADVDGDGNLDLFIGGRVVPGRYPEPASSLLFRQQNGEWVLDEENTRQLAKVGLVNGAVFSDLNGDGWPDLILAVEWGPIRIFRNDHGKLVPWDWRVTLPDAGFSFRSPIEGLGRGEGRASRSAATSTSSNLSQLTGWWTGVTTGDFDGDGRLDIVACNWGQNTKYESFRARPLRLYHGDFNGDGSAQLFEGYYEPKLKQMVPWRRLDEVAKTMPWLQAQFTSFAAYGHASIEEILGDRLPRATVLEANWLETTLFLNRGDHFEVVKLPFEAQLSPAFAACVGDLDGDGCEDLFLSQNFFAVAQETSRSDAGRGLWLRGDGRGGFKPVSGVESGLLIYGEQRGAALCDYDGDGRLDLCVAQNGAPTLLYHNEGARPGLRVHLEGPPGNPHGVGAMLRLQFTAPGNSSAILTHSRTAASASLSLRDAAGEGGGRPGWGPAREVHAGAGYWSQDSSTQVLALPGNSTQLQVRWPAGKTTLSALPSGAYEIWVNQEGGVRIK